MVKANKYFIEVIIILFCIIGGLWSLVPGSRQQKGGSVLADQSELLLVVIVTHSLGGPKSKNPFRQAVFTFTEDRGTLTHAVPHTCSTSHM